MIYRKIWNKKIKNGMTLKQEQGTGFELFGRMSSS